MNQELTTKFSNLDEGGVIEIVQKEIRDGTDPQEILSACQDGMSEIGEKFEKGEYYVSELMFSGQIFQRVNELIKPLFGGGENRKTLGKVVIGTVAGDIHDIGKDLVVGLLEANNFEVHDIGIDQPKEAFISKIKETGATILGLSGLLTIAFDSMKQTIKALEDEGLRDKVKVIIGGGTINSDICGYVGADDWGSSAQSAVTFCKKNIQT